MNCVHGPVGTWTWTRLASGRARREDPERALAEGKAMHTSWLPARTYCTRPRPSASPAASSARALATTSGSGGRRAVATTNDQAIMQCEDGGRETGREAPPSRAHRIRSQREAGDRGPDLGGWAIARLGDVPSGCSDEWAPPYSGRPAICAPAVPGLPDPASRGGPKQARRSSVGGTRGGWGGEVQRGEPGRAVGTGYGAGEGRREGERQWRGTMTMHCAEGRVRGEASGGGGRA
ncbi:hypothetical protein DAEQUDRAFT_569181 [Daedalea quercina L-15889]|uniref:Uncharacterized protein n=1 Tax=Daedalea quercina L-15889 TaxID=1314783 RepID=A0A165LVZ4_9APHY|nr:hypothetical protein DAEQUDRAFT_569181 [Daedalea quercina L-15889]